MRVVVGVTRGWGGVSWGWGGVGPELAPGSWTFRISLRLLAMYGIL